MALLGAILGGIGGALLGGLFGKKKQPAPQVVYPGGTYQQQVSSLLPLYQMGLLSQLQAITTPELAGVTYSQYLSDIKNEAKRQLEQMYYQEYPYFRWYDYQTGQIKTRPTFDEYVNTLKEQGHPLAVTYTQPVSTLPPTTPLMDIISRMQEPIRTSIEQAQQQYGQIQDILRGLATSPWENPYLQSVISGIQRKMEEETARGIERLASRFQLAGMTTSSAFPTQARLLAERGLTSMQEQLAGILADIAERQRQTQLSALEGLIKIPQLQVGLATQLGQLEFTPIDILSQLATTAGGLQQQQLSQTGVVIPPPKPSLFENIMRGVSGALGGYYLGQILTGGTSILPRITSTPTIAPSTYTPYSGMGGYLGFQPIYF
jgi:hypothetical protein